MAETINLDFNGYWREVNKGSIPAKSGVYLVYVCTYNGKEVALKKLIYIGESGDVNNRIDGHEKWEEWRKYAGNDEQICFSFGEATEIDRERGEAALINYHKPPCNDEYIDNFPFEKTTVYSTGRCLFITSPITVE